MEMKCSIRLRDIVTLQIWSLTQPAYSLPGLLPGGMGGALLVGVNAAGNDPGWMMMTVLLLAGFGAGGFLVLLASLPVAFLVAIMHGLFTHALGEKEIGADAEAFWERDDRNLVRVPWQEVKGVSRSSHYILVRISTFKFSIIPRRDFPGESEFLGYYARLVMLWAKARTRNDSEVMAVTEQG